MDVNKPNMTKLSLGPHEPIKDVGPARIDPRLPKGSTRTGYDRFER